MSNTEIVNKHYDNFAQICKVVTLDHNYSIDLCNDLCLYLLEKVDNKQLNYLESIKVGEDRTQLDYYFFRAAQLRWSDNRLRTDRHQRDLTEDPRYFFEDLEHINKKLINDESIGLDVQDIKRGLNEADRCYIDLYLSCNGSISLIEERTNINYRSLKKYQEKLFSKCKHKFK